MNPGFGTTRRELLKLSPALLLGAFAVPAWREGLLTRGVAWSDRASAAILRSRHVASTFPDAAVTPFEQFPYNGFLPPKSDFANWTLAVGGAVAKPGAYDLAAVRALPKQVQNTRHVCVEGGTSSVGSAARDSPIS